MVSLFSLYCFSFPDPSENTSEHFSSCAMFSRITSCNCPRDVAVSFRDFGPVLNESIIARRIRLSSVLNKIYEASLQKSFMQTHQKRLNSVLKG